VNNAPCAHCLVCLPSFALPSDYLLLQADGRDAVSLAEQIAGGGILAGRGWSGSLLAQEQVERSLWTRAGPSFLSYIDHAAGRVEPKVWGYGFSVED
jgi:hypothetical protein